jgi:hypothetical protein
LGVPQAAAFLNHSALCRRGQQGGRGRKNKSMVPVDGMAEAMPFRL